MDVKSGVFNLWQTNGQEFLAKYDTDANFIWAGEFGYNGNIHKGRICIGSDNSIYVTSTLWYGTYDYDPGPQVYNLVSTYKSPYIAKYSSTGGLVWAFCYNSTVITNHDEGLGIDVDASDNLYVCGGKSDSVDMDPGSGVVIKPGRAFIAKFTSGGSYLWAHAFSSSGTITEFLSLKIDPAGKVVIGGAYNDMLDMDPSSGVNFLPHISTLTSWRSEFIAKYASDGTFIWATTTNLTVTYGGSATLGIACYGSDKIYIGGKMGNYNFAKLTYGPAKTITNVTPDQTSYCKRGLISINYTSSNNFNSDNVFTAQLSNSTGSFASPTTIGTLSGTNSGTITGYIPAGIATGSGYRVRVISSSPVITSIDNGVNISINPLPTPIINGKDTVCEKNSSTYTSATSSGRRYKWITTNGTIQGSDSSVSATIVWGNSPTGKVKLIEIITTTGCRDTTEKTVVLSPLPIPNFTGDTVVCAKNFGNYQSNSAIGITNKWKVLGGTIVGLSNLTTLKVSWADTISGKVLLEQTNNVTLCKDSINKTIIINPLPTVIIVPGNESVCQFNSYTYNSNSSGVITDSWFTNGGTIIGTSTSKSVIIRWDNLGTKTIKLIQTNTLTGCKDSSEKNIVVNPLPQPVISGSAAVCLSIDNIYSVPLQTGRSYLWSVNSGTIKGANNANSVAISWNTIGPDTVTCVETISSTGCKDSSKIQVRVRKITTTQSTPSLDFGILDGCTGSKTMSFEITNTGTDDITFLKQSSTSTGFVITDGLPFILSKGATKTLTMRYTPSSKGISNGTVTLSGDPCTYELNLSVKGEKLQLAFSTDKPSVNYGVSLSCGTAVQRDSIITITNSGTDKMTVTSAQINAPYSVVSPAFPQDIVINGSLKVTVRYAPTVVGSYSSDLQLPFTAGSCTDVIKVSLNGSHIIPDAGVTPTDITFPDMIGCDPARDTIITIKNPNTIDVDVISITPSDAQFKILTALPLKVKVGESQQIKVRFDPSANGAVTATMKVTTNPCSREVTVTLKGNKQGISFSTPDTVDVGTLIACSQTSVSANFMIKNTSGGGLAGTISNVSSSSGFSSTIKTGDALANGVDKPYTVTFTPTPTTQEGVVYGKLDVSFLPCDINKTIILKATKTDVRLAADASIDYGSVQTGATRNRTIIIRNTGTATMTVSSLSGIAAPFTQGIVTPALPAILKPNDTLKVEVIFTALTGTFTATVKAQSTVPCAVETSTVLTAEGSDKPLPSIIGVGKDAGSVMVGQPKDDAVTVTNDGTVDMNITGAIFDATSNAAFSIVGGQFPIAIKVGETKLISFTFAPTVVGAVQGLMLITGDQDTASARVQGLGIDNTVSAPSLTSTASIVFDSVCVGQTKTLQATITNNGNQSLQLLRSEWVTNTGTVFSTTLLPQTLSVGNSITQLIDYSPTSAGITSGQVRWIADKDSALTNVSGIGKVCSINPDTARTTIGIKDITAQPGEKVNLTLFIAKQENMNVSGAPTTFTATVRYNKNMLFITDQSIVCTNSDENECVINISGTTQSGNDIALLPCIATLGNADYAAIILEDFRWTDGTVISDVIKQDGSVKITGTCDEGGVRLYIPTTSHVSLATRPNPAGNLMRIEYGLVEDSQVTLELINSLGTPVQTIISNAAISKGQYALNQDMSLISNGVYFLRLTTQNSVLISRVDVVK